MAGGQSQRLRLNDQFKWELPFGPENNLLSYIINKARQQTKQLLLNGPAPLENGQCTELTEALAHYGVDIIPDEISTIKGPLNGLLSCLHWGQAQKYPWIAVFACDTPFFPDDLLTQLLSPIKENITHAKAVTLSHNERLHPTFGLWSTDLHDELKSRAEETGIYSLSKWAHIYAHVISIKSTRDDIDPFFNINTPADYQDALKHINYDQGSKKEYNRHPCEGRDPD